VQLVEDLDRAVDVDILGKRWPRPGSARLEWRASNRAQASAKAARHHLLV
jgi:hypothetical protein